MSFFNDIPLAPPNSILGVALECKNDQSSEKVDLVIGAYRDENGKPFVLNCVREAEKVIFNANMDHEYLSQDGHREFNELTQKLMFGNDSPLMLSGRLYTIQGISGTGSLKLGFDFISKFLRSSTVYLPNVTWNGHESILEATSLKYSTYRYLDSTGIALDFEGLCQDLISVPDRSIILFHSCAHNPSGIDPSEEQWIQLLDIVRRKNLLPFFDNAYQGFVSGCPNKDAFAVRLFSNSGLNVMVACSFAKNFGLYGERVGALHFVTSSADESNNVASQLRVISRSLYSTCPCYGARIVSIILGNSSLRNQWEEECASMANRILTVRKLLYDELIRQEVKGSWSHVTTQRGMFSYTGISSEVVARLKTDHHVYMLSNGRISLAGLNLNNIPRFVAALADLIGRIQ